MRKEGERELTTHPTLYALLTICIYVNEYSTSSIVEALSLFHLAYMHFVPSLSRNPFFTYTALA